MEIKIHTNRVTLGEAQEASILRKFEKLSHLAARIEDESSEIRVDLSYEDTRSKNDSYGCILTMFVPQETLRAEARDETLENVVDAVIEKIKGQIEHYKNKVQHISDHK